MASNPGRRYVQAASPAITSIESYPSYARCVKEILGTRHAFFRQRHYVLSHSLNRSYARSVRECLEERIESVLNCHQCFWLPLNIGVDTTSIRHYYLDATCIRRHRISVVGTRWSTIHLQRGRPLMSIRMVNLCHAMGLKAGMSTPCVRRFNASWQRARRPPCLGAAARAARIVRAIRQ